MKDVEALLNQIIEQSGDEDAQYLYGVEYSSETNPGWKAMVRFSKEGVPPVVMAATTKRQLKKEMKNYLNGEDAKAITLRYHNAQIALEQQAIRFHETAIKEYEDAHS